MKIVSLFDGMACGMLAMLGAGVEVDEYYAYEIDKYAVQTATHNFPNIIECGDVFKADFTQYKDVDFIVGGSPCTYWSIAQKNNRETEASGLGWELFSQYVRALNEIKPQFFIYENNKSMSKAIRESITEAFGFDAICINSALVSAQNRQRLYWVGKRNEDGTYSKVDVQQPEDRGILLRDILDGGIDLTSRDKSFAYTTRCNSAIPEDTIKRNRHTMVAEPICTSSEGKSPTLKAQYYKNGMANFITNGGFPSSAVAEPVNITNEGKAQCVRATCYKDGIRNMVGNDIDKRTCVAEAVNTTPDEKSQTIKAQYQQTSVANICKYTSTYGATGVAEEVADSPKQVGAMPRPNGELSTSQGFRIYDVNAKTVTLKGNAGGAGGKTGLYAMPVYEFTELNIRNNAHIAINENAIRGVQDKNNASCAENFYEFTDRKANTLTTAHVPKVVDDFNKYSAYAEPCEWDDDGTPTKAISSSDGKTYTVYSVLNGIIVIKGKEYPIKLKDGYYIIRKLSVNECKRLQTVPEWYEFPVSNAQAYKMLGNGWTVEVIVHLIKSCLTT